MTDTDRLAALLHEAHGDWYNGHRSDDVETARRLIAAGVTLDPTPPDAPRDCGCAHNRDTCPTPPDALREAADLAARVLDAAIGAAECGYVPNKEVQKMGRDSARALRAALEAER